MDDIREKLDAIFDAALAEHREVMCIAQGRADQVKAFLDNGDLDGLRRFVEEELRRLEKRSPGT